MSTEELGYILGLEPPTRPLCASIGIEKARKS